MESFYCSLGGASSTFVRGSVCAPLSILSTSSHRREIWPWDRVLQMGLGGTSSFVFSPPLYWREVGGLDGDRASGEKPDSQMTVEQAPYPTCIGLGRGESKFLSCYNSPWLAYLQTRLEDRCVSELSWSLQSLVGDVHRISEWKRSVTSLRIASAQCL